MSQVKVRAKLLAADSSEDALSWVSNRFRRGPLSLLVFRLSLPQLLLITLSRCVQSMTSWKSQLTHLIKVISREGWKTNRDSGPRRNRFETHASRFLCMVINCTTLHGNLERYYLSPAYGIEACIGILGNLLAVLGYIFCLSEWQSCNIYLFNLAVSNLVFLCMLPRLSYLYANDQTETQPFACVFNRYVLHVNLYSSILFMVWVSMDRFLLVKYPFRNHYLLRVRTALILTGLSWIAVNVEVAPMVVLMVQDLQSRNWSLCKDFASLNGDMNLLGYSLGLTFTGYILPLLALCGFSYQIAHLLRTQEKALQRQTTYKRPLRIVAATAAMFLILYTPYHVMRNVKIAFSQPWAPRMELCTKAYVEGLYILTRPIAFFQSVINPVFYFFMGDKFRELLLTKIRKLMHRTT